MDEAAAQPLTRGAIVIMHLLYIYILKTIFVTWILFSLIFTQRVYNYIDFCVCVQWYVGYTHQTRNYVCFLGFVFIKYD